MHAFFLLLGSLIIAVAAHSQCSETDKTKILLVGDSWAFFMNVDGTINDVAADWGHTNVSYYTNLTLSENGAETDDFLTPTKVSELSNRLATMPDLEAVHLSIGGNDFLGSWNVDFTQAQTDALAEAVMARLDTIIANIHAVRPDVHILWSGYVYTNFGEVIGSLPSFIQSTHPFFGTWESMGFPTFTQLNTIQNWFQDQIALRYASDPKVTYVKAPGLMQYVFGQTTNLAVPPGGSYAPFSVPLPLGDPSYPSPQNTMRDYGITKDCFHLSAAGYKAFIAYHFQKFYHHFLMDDAFVLGETTTSGHVRNDGQVSNQLVIGKQNGIDYAGILSFDLAQMADTALDRLSLFVRVDDIQGSNGFATGEITAEIIEQQFGDTPALEAADYATPAFSTATPCVFGSPEAGKWIRLEFPDAFLSYVHATGRTQIRLKYTGSSDGLITLRNSNNPDFQPVLNLSYGIKTLETSNLTSEPTVLYPNPASSEIHLSPAEAIEKIEIYALTGQLFHTVEQPTSSISVAELPTGIYLVRLYKEQGEQTIRLIKY